MTSNRVSGLVQQGNKHHSLCSIGCTNVACRLFISLAFRLNVARSHCLTIHLIVIYFYTIEIVNVNDIPKH